MVIPFHNRKRRIGPSFSFLHASLKGRILNKKIQERNLGFTTPSIMLLDASYIMQCLEDDVLLGKLRHSIDDVGLDLYTTTCVVEELRKYIEKFHSAKLSIFNELLDNLNIKSCDHKEAVHSQQCINSDVSDPDLSEFQRLLFRLKFYGLAKIDVIGDGNCLPRALSEQTTHSQASYKIVRDRISQQLLQNKPMYAELVSQFLQSIREEDPAMSKLSYDEYVAHLSNDEVEGGHVSIQAAADLFKAKIVCLCSTRNIAFLEHHPSGLEVCDRVLYLALLTGTHADSMYPICIPVDICSHLFEL